jgi:hypothetical protein
MGNYATKRSKGSRMLELLKHGDTQTHGCTPGIARKLYIV